eukprot:scaffold3866_cov99-Skeletonema_marinoi.AAC.4
MCHSRHSNFKWSGGGIRFALSKEMQYHNAAAAEWNNEMKQLSCSALLMLDKTVDVVLLQPDDASG